MKNIFEKQVYFRLNNQVYSQRNDSICKSSFGPQSDMKMIAIFVTRNVVNHVFEDVQNFIYDHKVLLKLHKQYYRHLKPEEHAEKLRLIKVNDRKRDASPSRINYKKQFEKKRKFEPSRKASRQLADKKRDATSSSSDIIQN